MINEEKYRRTIKNMFNKRKDGELTKSDITIISYLVFILDDNEVKEIKQKQIVNYTGISKSDVSKSN